MIGPLKVLVANLKANDPPIIVSAQTNHALDQLLNHIMKFEPYKDSEANLKAQRALPVKPDGHTVTADGREIVLVDAALWTSTSALNRMSQEIGTIQGVYTFFAYGYGDGTAKTRMIYITLPVDFNFQDFLDMTHIRTIDGRLLALEDVHMGWKLKDPYNNDLSYNPMMVSTGI
ncbi:uncharacterized protein LY89DRAFT_786727 [Mollisia scopiformis]|uniref:Uncharacterized protein n=1 Tax=Mollisia scopiformis TaxID=149040 RepID=A0A194WSZ0_MOLSC|nr:uncharacterized protein LY89DRAFT_786727 [Mollisia scopiformis]KUJ11073.1 hypothetical protein LY89DRAFT_786727 [Mollisia scopiformis]